MDRPKNVLAVDDTPANLVTLDAVLGDSYNLVRALSGREALEILESRDDIDVIVLDVQMPGLDGFQTASRIKQMESARHIPIVFITAVYREDPWVRKGYEVGGLDYFSKPYDPDVLKLKIGIYADMKQRADFLKERERQLRLSEELLATARYLCGTRGKADVGIVVADAHGSIRQMNDELLRIFKCPVGTDAAADVPEGNERFISDQLVPVLTSVRASQASRREPVQIRCADGSAKSILCSVSLLRDSNSVAAGMAMIVHDASQSAGIEGDLERRVAELSR